MARINFIELPASDLGSVKTFYSAVFGWELTNYLTRLSRNSIPMGKSRPSRWRFLYEKVPLNDPPLDRTIGFVKGGRGAHGRAYCLELAFCLAS